MATFGEIQLDLAEHFRRREFTDVFKVAGIVSCLQANEIHLGIADEAIDIEAGRNVPTGAATAGAASEAEAPDSSGTATRQVGAGPGILHAAGARQRWLLTPLPDDA